jgi:hypothetical protein
MTPGYTYALPGSFFATRARAKDIREAIEQQTGLLGMLTLDCSAVKGMTVSFADELIAKLALTGLRLTLTGLDDDVRETAETALARRDLSPAVTLEPAADTAFHDESCCMNGAWPGWGPHPGCPGARGLERRASLELREREQS